MFLNGEGPPGLAAGLHGGAKRSRTADLLNAIQALYQLSYSPRSWVVRREARPRGRRGTYSNSGLRSRPARSVFSAGEFCRGPARGPRRGSVLLALARQAFDLGVVEVVVLFLEEGHVGVVLD